MSRIARPNASPGGSPAGNGSRFPEKVWRRRRDYLPVINSLAKSNAICGCDVLVERDACNASSLIGKRAHSANIIAGALAARGP